MLVEGFRHSHGGFGQLQIGRNLIFSFLNAPFNLPHIVQVFAQTGAIGSRKLPLQRRYLIHHRIEQAAALLLASEPIGLPSPNSFSNTTCGLFSIGSGVVGVF